MLPHPRLVTLPECALAADSRSGGDGARAVMVESNVHRSCRPLMVTNHIHFRGLVGPHPPLIIRAALHGNDAMWWNIGSLAGKPCPGRHSTAITRDGHVGDYWYGPAGWKRQAFEIRWPVTGTVAPT